MRTSGRVILVLVSLFVRAIGQAPADLETTRKLLASDPVAALAAAATALEHAPEDVDWLHLASEAAEASPDAKDLALWYAVRAQAAAWTSDDKKVRARIKALEARVASLDPLPVADRAPLDEHVSALFEMGRLCARKKLWANAVSFFRRCDGTAMAERATKELDRLYRNKKALQAVLDSGVDVPVIRREKRSASWIARKDARHAIWPKALRVKTENYTVITDMGWELAHDVANAMEQMNRFYRRVFKHKTQGGGTARCEIRIFKRRDDYVKYADGGSELGYYSPSGNFVATFDPREIQSPISELWETLFHEASHQFTCMIWPTTAPGWLDEGTATYFEGARLLANGRVLTNGVVHARLDSLKDALKTKNPTLRQVVSYHADGSYDAEYYCVGWGLVYFMLNYEDAECERIYRPLYDAYVKSYRTGGRHDVFKRFTDYFVKRAKQPGVKTFEDFEKRFTEWCLELHDLHFGPPERAQIFIERGRKQRSFKKTAAAVESFRSALRKSPGDIVALRELGDTLYLRREHDAAMAAYREILELGSRMDPKRRQADAAMMTHAEQMLLKLHKVVAKQLLAMDDGLVAQAAAAAGRYVEAGYPRMALHVLDEALRVVGPVGTLRKQRGEVAAKSGVDVWKWRRPAVAAHLEAWTGSEAWRHVDGRIAVVADSPDKLLLRDVPPERYRLEATLEVARIDPDGEVGLLFGVGVDDVWRLLGCSAGGGLSLWEVDRNWVKLAALKAVAPVKKKSFRLAIEVERDRVRCFLDGKPVGEKTLPPTSLRGRCGFAVSGTSVHLSDIRLGY